MWARWAYERGFGVYENFVVRGRKEMGNGRYSVGNETSLADVFLYCDSGWSESGPGRWKVADVAEDCR